MNGSKLLLDTNIILFLLEGDATLAEFLHGKQLYISIITELELLSFKDISQKEEKVIKEFLEELIVIDLNTEIKEKTITLRKTTNLKLPDSIIAATSFIINMPLITSDKQFKSLKDLKLLFYEK